MPIEKVTDDELISWLSKPENKQKILTVCGWDEKSLNEQKIRNEELIKINASLLAKIPNCGKLEDKEKDIKETPKGDATEILYQMQINGELKKDKKE